MGINIRFLDMGSGSFKNRRFSSILTASLMGMFLANCSHPPSASLPPFSAPHDLARISEQARFSVRDPLCPQPNAPSCPSIYSEPALLPQIVASQSDTQSNLKRLPVALLVPLSGQYASYGQAMVDAAQLAVHNLATENFILLIKDTRGTPDGAIQAAREAMAEGARLVLGPLLSTSVRAAAPFVTHHKINMLAFTTDQRVAGKGVFVMGFLPRTEIERIVSYAASKGLRRFAALAPSNDYGRLAIQELRRAVVLHNGVVTVETFYDPDIADYSGTVRNFAAYDARAAAAERRRQELQGLTDESSQRELLRLQQREASINDVPFDALLLPDTGQRLLSIAPLLPFYDIDPKVVRFLGSGLWDEPLILKEMALYGGWFSAPSPKLRQRFEAQFTENFGESPVRLATLAYDAAALAAILGQGRTAFPYSTEAIISPNGFAGIDGIFRFLPDGLIERGLAVLQLTGSTKPKLIAEGRQTFQEDIQPTDQPISRNASDQPRQQPPKISTEYLTE